MNDGPTGFLDKGSIKAEMKAVAAKGLFCEGVDTSRCLWPTGIFYKEQPYCAEGFEYSYLKKACYLNSFVEKGKHCGTLFKADAVNRKCGHWFKDVCTSTSSQCVVDVSKLDLSGHYVSHFVCNAYSQEWVEAA